MIRRFCIHQPSSSTTSSSFAAYGATPKLTRLFYQLNHFSSNSSSSNLRSKSIIAFPKNQNTAFSLNNNAFSSSCVVTSYRWNSSKNNNNNNNKNNKDNNNNKHEHEPSSFVPDTWDEIENMEAEIVGMEQKLKNEKVSSSSSETAKTKTTTGDEAAKQEETGSSNNSSIKEDDDENTPNRWKEEEEEEAARKLSEDEAEEAADRAALRRYKIVIAFLIGGAAAAVYANDYAKKKLGWRKADDSTYVSVTTRGRPSLGGPFVLVDFDGNVRSQADFLGSWQIFYFGFTHCPEICPIELNRMTKVVEAVRETRPKDKIQPLFVSCDVKRDSLAAVKEYLSIFHKDFIGLVGTPNQVDKCCKSYRIYYSLPDQDGEDTGDYLIDHSIAIFLFDPKGRFVDFFGSRYDHNEITTKVIDYMGKLEEDEEWTNY